MKPLAKRYKKKMIGITSAVSFVNSAQVKKMRQNTYWRTFLDCTYWIKVINDARTNMVMSESFLPGIHATAWVRAG
jgi:hypothetical protein